MPAFDKARAILKEGLVQTNNSFEVIQELFDLDIEPWVLTLRRARVW